MNHTKVTTILVFAVLFVLPSAAYAANGVLTVTSFPSGAEVVIDGVSKGRFTPEVFHLSTGQHEVTLKSPDDGWMPET